MSFDSIPEDEKETYECDCGGNRTENKQTGLWECDSCDVGVPISNEELGLEIEQGDE